MVDRCLVAHTKACIRIPSYACTYVRICKRTSLWRIYIIYRISVVCSAEQYHKQQKANNEVVTRCVYAFMCLCHSEGGSSPQPAIVTLRFLPSESLGGGYTSYPSCPGSFPCAMPSL